MKNRLLILLFLFFYSTRCFSENLLVEAKNILFDKKTNISIFQNEVVVTTEDNNIIKSDYAEYNKNEGFLKLTNNIIAKDNKGNIIKANYAEYYEFDQMLKTKGPTFITTTENYEIKSEDILFDNKKRFINSKKSTVINDNDGNRVNLDNFEYLIDNNIFKSVGLIKLTDKGKNTYEFSQIYIDTKKKEILGTDTKAFLKQDSFKMNKNNKPRVFANTFRLKNGKSSFGKGIFTVCDYRKNDKCPPWSVQSSKMLHDNKKKTIYYDNAIVKIYNIPIFYFPKLSHPDPTVDRRSGFLSPSISDTKNLGTGISIPYFFDLGKDKNFTFTNRLYALENPLFLGAYHQEFKNSHLKTDFGYTKGYKKTSTKKKAGNKSHFFSSFSKVFEGGNGSLNNLDIKLQNVSNDKYFKLYRVESDLVDTFQDNLENSFNFTHENDDLFFGFQASMHETLMDDYNDKYEYVFPEITVDKHLISDENFGSLDMESSYKVHNYDTNKLSKFFVNNFNWKSNNITSNSAIDNKILSTVKNVNYEAKNIDTYKDKFTNEVYGALGLLTELNLQKKQGNSNYLLTPKTLIKFAPGSMRKDQDGSRLEPLTAFSMNRLESNNNFETGLSGAIGLDYKVTSKNFKEFDFSIAQVISEKENKKMASVTGLDEKLSDLVGYATLEINDNTNLSYNFALDQNYNDINYSDIGGNINFGPTTINFNYLQERKHIAENQDQDYFKTKIDHKLNDKGLLSFATKRNIITNSADYYNLSYEYINDCLRAGLVYRREFYTDSELEAENSLLFKITLTPFGEIASPSLNQ